ncbi:hypothetical protein A9K75_06715 [Campylobacter fetus subsp. testudinum]|uniref:Abi family protein n=1 Tax=Campylobacter fetus TaxID=196 RepID=UPI000818C044|nr:Abi family protein [Campylobacter fetus]OCR99557.1 hypothetical protein A9K75_06715 [Campylobacter fetus subsp. testudinum]
MEKYKLDLNQQIEQLEKLGIKFEKYSKKEAYDFLRNNNYLFKIKSYSKNYDINLKSNQYINLDFSYLVELSTLDMYLRRIILNIGLNIEHLLKVELNAELSQNNKEDGYSIVKEFLLSNLKFQCEIDNKAERESFVRKLLVKNKDHLPYWILIEVLDFGSFLNFYQFYFNKYPNRYYNNHYTLGYCVRILRNGAAHNNCILNTIKIPYTNKFNPKKNLQTTIAKIGSVSKNTRGKILNDPIFHDILATVVLFNQICNSKSMKKATFNEIIKFLKRCKKHKQYFQNNNLISSKFKAIVKIILGLKKVI